MSLRHQLHSLITNQDLSSPISHNSHYHSSSLLSLWNSYSHHQKRNILVSISILLSLSYYILKPSLFPPPANSNMFTKRPDKYTTGLINMRNDCFANSSLQAYSALPGFTDYLNKFIISFNQLSHFIIDNKININDFISSKDISNIANSKFKSNNLKYKFDIPLHISLASLIKKLQETQMTSRTISVWTFLHSLEKIFNAKISKSQHDAQELTQLINETLENENINLLKILKKLKQSIHNSNHNLDSIIIPEFPFGGLILSQMKCLSCSHVSKPHFSPFLMVTLHAPQKISTDLETLLNENELESIDGYQCLKCRVNKIVENESNLPQISNDLVNQLIDLNNEKQLFINEDLSSDLENFIKNYNVSKLDISKITSTVFRKTQILKPPKVFGLHLSRSDFNGVDITRNPCRVSFKDNLNLSIGQEYHDQLKQFQAAATQEEEFEQKNIKSNILTTDEDDMEDEEVQREDIEERGDDEDDEDEITEGTATEGDDDDDDDDDEDDNDSVTSAESIEPSIITNATLKNNNNTSSKSNSASTSMNASSSKNSSDLASNSTTLKAPETLNNAPITEDQTDHLKHHFKSFKFNDNDIYKYKLKAVIRHQGSHTQGHYECYKRKPLYVKDKDGTIFKLSPEVNEDVLSDAVFDVTQVTDEHEKSSAINQLSNNNPDNSITKENNINNNNNGTLKSVTTNDSTSTTITSGRRRKFSLSLSGSNSNNSTNDNGPPSNSIDSTTSTSQSTNDQPPSISEEEEFNNAGNHGTFRRKFSNMMGRRPSIVQADPEHANIQEIMHSGLTTPAELLVDDLESGYFTQANIEKSMNNLTIKDEQNKLMVDANNINNKPNNNNNNKVKMKKIPTLIKHPYWRISDAQVTEVSRASVLCETESVYMLYYERVDRKQVKGH